MNEERNNLATTIDNTNTANNMKEVTMNNTTNNIVYISESEVPTVIDKVNGAEFFHMTYYKANGERREATCQRHVSHPRNEALTPKGTGESATEAMENGRVKYYEPHHAGLNGEGVFRQCRIDRIESIKVRGVVYKVIH